MIGGHRIIGVLPMVAKLMGFRLLALGPRLDFNEKGKPKRDYESG